MDPPIQGSDPFRLLPDELILEIIKCMGVGATIRGYCASYPRDLAALIQLSRRWRDIIYTEPSFWCQIKLHPSTTDDDIAKYIERSKEHPLSIFWMDAFDSEKDKIPPQWTLLAQCSHRWHKLALQVSTTHLLDAMLASLEEISTPILDEIHVIIPKKYESPSSVVSLNAIPRLRHLVLSHYPISAVQFCSKSITHLELRPPKRFPYETFNDLMNSLPSLRYLNLIDAFDWRIEDWPIIRHSNLRTLVMADALYYMWRYFKVLDCPGLHTLVLFDTGNDNFPSDTCIQIMPQYAAVEELILVGSSHQSLSSLSVCVPNITRLSLLVRNHHQFETSANGLDLPTTWPHLKSISINPAGESSRSISSLSIIRIASYRRRSGHPLEAIFIPENEWDLFHSLKDRVDECSLYMRLLPCVAQYKLPPVYQLDW